MYADFNFYKAEFRGVQITDEDIFASLSVKAEAFINSITFHRISGNDVSRDVKMAVCAVVEVIDGQEAQTRGIASENNDGYAVSYVSSADDTAAQRRLYDTARFYLTPELLYAGVDMC